MKGLLHSKRFRRNLYKWLFMYVGVMTLLTTVITYSKYVSRLMTVDSSARVARFQISVHADESECSSSLECNTGKKYRPTQSIDYYYTLDANIEVKTDIFLTIGLNQQFRLIGVWEIDGSGKEIPVSSLSSFGVRDEFVDGVPEHYQLHEFKAGTFTEKTQKKYKVTVLFNNTYSSVGDVISEEDYDMVKENKNYDILRIDFSATQVK